MVVERCVLLIPLFEPAAMTWDSVASTKLADVLKPKSTGEPVNVHVVQSVREPQPDFAAMQRLVQGGEQTVVDQQRGGQERDVSSHD